MFDARPMPPDFDVRPRIFIARSAPGGDEVDGYATCTPRTRVGRRRCDRRVAAYVYMYEGSLDVAVQDDSGAWAHVWVTFTQVWVHEAGKSEDVGWHNLTVTQTSIDLASLVNVSELLASARVGPGKYTEIRLVVIAATGKMLDGTTVVFSVPSGDVKAVTPFEVRSGTTTRLTVDINLARSIVANGSSWTFTPVLGQIKVA